MKVLLREEARSDVLEAFAWYEERRSGLGVELRDALMQLLPEFCGIHSRTQRATEAYGGLSSAGFRMPCTFGSIQMRLSSLG